MLINLNDEKEIAHFCPMVIEEARFHDASENDDDECPSDEARKWIMTFRIAYATVFIIILNIS